MSPTPEEAAAQPLTLQDVELVIHDLAACITIGATRGETMTALRESLARQPDEPIVPLMDRVLAARAARGAIAKAAN